MNALHGPRDAHDRAPERYARWLGWGTSVGLAALVLGFAVYAFGLLPSQVAPDRLPALWSQPVAQYLAATAAPTGWRALLQWHHGDALALVGVVLLAGVSVPCLAALAPAERRSGDSRFAWLLLAEAAVIVIAASGLFAGGHG